MMSGPKSDTTGGSLSCIKTQCDAKNSCVYRCFISDLHVPPLPLPPPPPPEHSHPAASQSHMAPFLIAAVCILGISFLLLTTCTIILRWRFTRRRRNRESGGGSDGDITTDDSEMAAVSGGGFDHPIWHITTVGLQQSVIDSITAFKYKKVDNLLTEGSDCSVCLTEFEEDDDLRLLPKCSHAFHLSCIDMWLGSHKNCPICRAPVVNESFTGSNLAARSERWSYLRDSSVAGEENQSRGESSGSSTGGGSSGGGGGGEKEIRIAELLKKNGELRVLSDLGVNYRFGWVDEEEEGLETIKRSFSFNALAVTAICEVVGNGNNGNEENEGNRCSGSDGSNASVGLPDGKLEVENVVKDGSSSGSVTVQGILTDKSPTIGRSFQEGAVSVMRSMSSGGKLFSFRRTKSQASILPL